MAKKASKKTTKVATATGRKPVARKPAGRKIAAGTARAAKTATAEKKKTSASTAVKSPLSRAELKQFRQTLLDKRRSLLGDLSGIQAEALRKNRQDGTGDLSTLPTHPADIGTDNYEQEFTLGLLESERRVLAEIDQALERIDNRTYGICLGTGQPIGLPRLKARPWAKFCIEYARLIEKGLVGPDDHENRRQEEPGVVADDDEDADDDEEDSEDDPDRTEAGETEVPAEEDEDIED